MSSVLPLFPAPRPTLSTLPYVARTAERPLFVSAEGFQWDSACN